MPADAAPAATRRFVLLGASNLELALPAVLGAIHRRADGPVEVLAAIGHGRSYGAWSRVLGLRWLPGIVGCGLWRELERRPPLPTHSLVTDVGNDLGYGEKPERVIGWVEACLERLAACRAEGLLTLLPRERFAAFAPWQVHLTHRLFFPFREAIAPEVLLARVEALDAGLRRLGGERGLEVVEPEPAWYGLDPLHVRRRQRGAVWDAIVGRWSLPDACDRPPPQRVARRGLPRLNAEQVRLFARFELATPQPAYRFADGSTLSLF